MSEKQEPVACVNGCSKFFKYTHPQPKREWVGLTDEEIDILSCEMVKGDKSVNWLCKVLEAKLKEKNHG